MVHYPQFLQIVRQFQGLDSLWAVELGLSWENNRLQNKTKLIPERKKTPFPFIGGVGFGRELLGFRQVRMEGFKQLWEHMQSMDRTSEKIAYGAGVAAGTVGGVAGVVCGSKMAFDWVIDRYDEFETRSIERIMRKIDANRRDRNKGVSVASRSILTEPKSDGM